MSEPSPLMIEIKNGLGLGYNNISIALNNTTGENVIIYIYKNAIGSVDKISENNTTGILKNANQTIWGIFGDIPGYLSSLFLHKIPEFLFSLTLDKISEYLLSITEILVISAIIYLLYLIARKIRQKEGGIVIMPFDTFSNGGSAGEKEKHDGKAISDLLTYELIRISNVHSHEIEPVPVTFPQYNTPLNSNTESVKYNLPYGNILESFYEERKLDIMPKSETLEYSVSEIGTVKTGVFEIPLGQLLAAFKRLLPEEYRHDTITGSLHEYTSYINIIAYMEGRDLHTWKIYHKISEKDIHKEDRINLMVRKLAYQIAHQLARIEEGSAASAESWLAWRYYTEALKAYHEFARSKRIYDRNKARKNCLMALKIEKSYDKPLGLLFILGFSYLDEKDRQVAWNIFKQVHDSKSELAPLAASGLGILKLTDLSYAEALDYFAEAIKSDRRDSLIWFGIGMAYEGLGNEYGYREDDGAIDPPLFDPQLFNNGGSDYFERALDAYNKTIEINPKNFEAWYHKGLIHCKRREFEEADKAFVNSLNTNPRNAEAWYHRGIVLSQESNYKEAIKAYNEIIKIDPPYFVGYANVREIHPHVTLSWLYKGVSLSKLGRYEDADQAYSKALEGDPTNAVAWYYKGMNLGKLGTDRHLGAFEAFGQAVKIMDDREQDYPSARFMQSFLNAFRCIWLAARPERALEAVNDALELCNQNSDLSVINGYNNALNNMFSVIKGITVFLLGKYEDALKCFDEAIKLDSESAYLWNRKYLALKALGRDNEATVASEKAAELGYVPPPRLIRVHFKKESICADQKQVIFDSLCQASEGELSKNLMHDNREICQDIDGPISLKEGYELAVNSIDSDGNRLELLLTKDGATVNWTKIGDEVQYTYEYHNMREEDIDYINRRIKLYFNNLDLSVT